ncbi:MAG: phosphotransferase, partial [Methanobacterium sp.]
MIINADLHIHGRYSIATSKNMIPPIMAPQARLKGLDLVATGDALHQKWLNLLEETIEESSDGIFSLK